MLYREDPACPLVITQPMHSWVSGQLARHWGNGPFAVFAPATDVRLAAEQHDIGFLEWDQKPALNPKTRRPYDFMEMPGKLHLEIWSRSVDQMTCFSRYAKLLVSLHVTWLCQRHQHPTGSEESTAIQSFLSKQREIQSNLLRSLQADVLYAAHSTTEAVERNRKLIAVWDWMSLLLCLACRGPHRIEDIPTTAGLATLAVTIGPDDPTKITLVPWPFADATVNMVVEGRQLNGAGENEQELAGALAKANPIAVELCLRPG